MGTVRVAIRVTVQGTTKITKKDWQGFTTKVTARVL